MNRPSLLHIIERLEGFLTRLPDSIRRPVLDELTPLKQLFLQQRAPRFVLTGSNRLPLQDVAATLFDWRSETSSRELLMELFRWHAIELGGRGTVSFLDARGADARTMGQIEEELKAQPPDMFFHLADDDARPFPAGELENLRRFATPPREDHQPKVIGVVITGPGRTSRNRNGESSITAATKTRTRLQAALQEDTAVAPHLVQVVDVQENSPSTFLSLLARTMPNEARVEMARIAQDRQVQVEVGQSLVKSTTAICAAIGAQPIPLADLPILTALQLLMVSGIMYIGGRERSLRAATEFVAALGVNVGAGMILREGTRALLKFFPGWGNVVCGAVAGAGTYAMGRASIGYFLEGFTITEARRTYLSSRRKRRSPASRAVKQIEPAR
ncbi:MAG TPA: hypothetical protein VM940_01310 [Chthoniobacterales bacterium]|jgi:uncharacterized protein (DUF697 family)|nr:hypothetical protein [Chthoniobacterales bacterium]